jgi:hypothetical protein
MYRRRSKSREMVLTEKCKYVVAISNLNRTTIVMSMVGFGERYCISVPRLNPEYSIPR